MLPVLDDFDRAMVEIPNQRTNYFWKGRANSWEIEKYLISKGLEQVEVKAGDAFDADFAEAITQIPAHRLRWKENCWCSWKGI
jgi:molecular chaperone GrpE